MSQKGAEAAFYVRYERPFRETDEIWLAARWIARMLRVSRLRSSASRRLRGRVTSCSTAQCQRPAMFLVSLRNDWHDHFSLFGYFCATHIHSRDALAYTWLVERGCVGNGSAWEIADRMFFIERQHMERESGEYWKRPGRS